MDKIKRRDVLEASLHVAEHDRFKLAEQVRKFRLICDPNEQRVLVTSEESRGLSFEDPYASDHQSKATAALNQGRIKKAIASLEDNSPPAQGIPTEPPFSYNEERDAGWLVKMFSGPDAAQEWLREHAGHFSLKQFSSSNYNVYICGILR